MDTNITISILYQNPKESTSKATPVYEINWLDNWSSILLMTLTSIPYCYIFANIYRQKFTKRLNLRIGNMAVAGFVVGWLTCLEFSEGKTAFAGPRNCPAFGFLRDVCWTVIGLSAFALNHERMRELNLFGTKMWPWCSWEVGCLWGIVEYMATNYKEKDGNCVYVLLETYNKVFHLLFETTKTLVFHCFVSFNLLNRMVKPRKPRIYQISGLPMDSENRALYNIALNSWRYFCFVFVTMWLPIGILDLIEKWALNYETLFNLDLLKINWSLKRLLLLFIPLGLIFVENRFKAYRNREMAMEVVYPQRQPSDPIYKTVQHQIELFDYPGLQHPILAQERCTCLSIQKLERNVAGIEMKERDHGHSVGFRRSKSCPITRNIWEAEIKF